MIDLTDCSPDRSLGNCNINATHALQRVYTTESTVQMTQIACNAVPKHTCKTIGDSVAGLWAGTVTEPGCVKQSKPLPENRRAYGGGTVASPQLAPLFRQASTLCCTWAWSPLNICTTGRPCLASQDTSKNPPSPSGDLGLSCQGPAIQTAPSGQGRNSERSRRVKESKFTFFLKCIKSIGQFREDTDLDPWRQHL